MYPFENASEFIRELAKRVQAFNFETYKLKIMRELSWHEVLELVNIGKDYIGKGNTGYRNSGNLNTGVWNKTNHSNGCFNTIEPKITFFNKESVGLITIGLKMMQGICLMKFQKEHLNGYYLKI